MAEHSSEPDTPMPEDPRANPEQTVDALEEKVSGQRHDQHREEDERGGPAYEQDIEPADTTDEEDMHRSQEPPA